MNIPFNNLCPCESGKKFGHCCLTASNTLAAQAQIDSHQGAATKTLAWLFDRHRKGMQVAREKLLDDLLSPEEIDLLGQLDADTANGVHINLTEWLLAQGSILVKGSLRKIGEYALIEGGPMLSPAQRSWITQLSKQPLRLYEVTELVAGEQMTLCDAIDFKAAPIVVRERSGTRDLELGTALGCRIMAVQNHFELSGCVYAFSRIVGQHVTEIYQSYLTEFSRDSKKTKQEELSLIILSRWLKQFVAPLPVPQMIDTYTGDPVLLITDHYLVNSWGPLVQALERQADIEGNITDGWHRHLQCTDGKIRSIASVEPDILKNQVSIFYQTQGYADQGRIWFDAIAGNTVKFRDRDIADLASLASQQNLKYATSRMPTIDQIPSAELTKAITSALQDVYANWADKPLPALQNKTPRQAIKTSAGLERVKGLIRSYESSEKHQAKAQQREPVSYAFLWKALGLEL